MDHQHRRGFKKRVVVEKKSSQTFVVTLAFDFCLSIFIYLFIYLLLSQKGSLRV